MCADDSRGRDRDREGSADDDDAKAPEAAKLPSSWAGDKSREVKRWSAEGRGDDPDARAVHAPLGRGIGDGKAFFFLFGFRSAAAADRRMLDMELTHIDDDVEALCRAGYTVIVDRQATRRDFFDMLACRAEGAQGLVPAGFYWSAHGFEDGAVQTCDGELIRPEDVGGKDVPEGLRVAIFAACYVGCRSRTWKEALGGGPLVVGWGRPVTIDRAVEFLDPDPDTETDLDDLIRRFLLVDAPLPGEQGERYSPAEQAVARGRIADLRERVENVAGMLGAPWRECERWLELRVPLDGGRHQIARVFVIDSNEPFSEGEPMLGVESDVGELSSLVDPTTLLSGLAGASYARVALVRSETDMPTIVTQGFLPLARVRDQDLAALAYQVADWGDTLERRIFGGDMR
jgi:hypothetical protein